MKEIIEGISLLTKKKVGTLIFLREGDKGFVFDEFDFLEANELFKELSNRQERIKNVDSLAQR